MKKIDYQPFKELKIIELASVLAGPSVGMFFAELGARVIKIENPNIGGDVTRSWKLASEDPSHPYSAYYSSVNWGKEVWMMDLKNKEDHQRLIAELADSDIVISNLRPSSAKKLGLNAETLQKLYPNLIYGEILGFRGKKRLAYDVVLQAECGYVSMNGSALGEEIKWPLAIIDVFAAHQLKEGLLLALLEKERSGRAAHVSTSLFEAGVSSLTNQATNWLMANHIPKPIGSLHPNIAPYGETFSCKDGKKIILAVGNDLQFKCLCESLGLEELIHDERFSDNQSRVKNRTELHQILSKGFQQEDRAALMDTLLNASVPAGSLRNVKEVFELEESENMLLEEEKEGKKLTTVSSNAFQLKFRS